MWVYKTLEIRQGRGRGEEEGMSNKVGLQNMQWRNSRRILQRKGLLYGEGGGGH